jgi:hypothetical protein
MEQMETFSDYTEDDRWDWDREDPRQYCHHGKFIGSWWGPDILCGDCEIGYDPSLNDMLGDIDRAIAKAETKKKGVTEFILEISDQFVGKSFDMETLTEVYKQYASMIDSYQKKINSLIETREKTIEEYSPFCEDFDDTSLLYNVRGEQIRLFDEFVKQMKEEL